LHDREVEDGPTILLFYYETVSWVGPACGLMRWLQLGHSWAAVAYSGKPSLPFLFLFLFCICFEFYF
jgi:hypothetical protein